MSTTPGQADKEIATPCAFPDSLGTCSKPRTAWSYAQYARSCGARIADVSSSVPVSVVLIRVSAHTRNDRGLDCVGGCPPLPMTEAPRAGPARQATTCGMPARSNYTASARSASCTRCSAIRRTEQVTARSFAAEAGDRQAPHASERPLAAGTNVREAGAVVCPV